MRSFKFTQTNSTPYKGLDGEIVFGDGTGTYKLLLQSAEGLGLPPVSIETQRAPFQVGASPIRTIFEPRTITLECSITVAGTGASKVAEATSIKRALSKLLSPVGMGYKPRTSLATSTYATYTGTLAYASDGVTYDRFIDCVPKVVEFPNKFWSDGFYKVRVVFECDDPTWYGAAQESVMGSVVLAPTGNWYSVAYSETKDLFVAVGGNTNYVMTSPDGITWTAGTLTNKGWQSVVWSEQKGLFCCVGNSSVTNNIATSPDGFTWTLRTKGTTADLYSVTYSERLGIFCGAGDSAFAFTSPDGITWTTRTCQAGLWLGLCYSEEVGRFVAVSSSGIKVQTSEDGITWTPRTESIVSSWASCIYVDWLQLFVAVGYAATSAIMTSPDGVTWTTRTNPAANGWRRLAHSSDLRVIVCVADSGTNRGMFSTDGITWTTTTIGSSQWYGVCYSSPRGCFIATPVSLGEYPASSYDGIDWTQSTTSDYLEQITNDGDVPAEFEIDIPVAGGETSKVIAIGDDFLWSGTGTPPSDHNLVFSTTGLKKGTVTVSTYFNNKDITQFGVSKFELYQQGEFFSLYVSGATTNNIYVRNTGTSAGAPTIRWKNRYLGV